MNAIVELYSVEKNQISKFLNTYFETNEFEPNIIKWKKQYSNPIEIADILGVYIENNDKYNFNMWISLDNNFFVHITNYNANKIIKYLFERYPY